MSDYKTPKDKLITNEQASALNEAFKSKHKSMSNDSNFSCSTWYSLEDLEGYINYAKEQAKAQRMTVDGIRFYFGTYPEGTEDKSKVGQNTMFMCPTGKSSESGGLLRSSGEDDDDGGNGSQDITTIPAMNYGNTGNPPKNDYGE